MFGKKAIYAIGAVCGMLVPCTAYAAGRNKPFFSYVDSTEKTDSQKLLGASHGMTPNMIMHFASDAVSIVAFITVICVAARTGAAVLLSVIGTSDETLFLHGILNFIVDGKTADTPNIVVDRDPMETFKRCMMRFWKSLVIMGGAAVMLRFVVMLVDLIAGSMEGAIL